MEALRLVALFAGTAGVLLFLAHRFLFPISRAAALILFLLPMLPTGRALLTGAHYGPLNIVFHSAPLSALRSELPRRAYRNSPGSDAAIQMLPWHQAVRAAAAEGEWPLLNRFMLCGDVLLGTLMPAAFHPVTWLGFLLPLSTAWTLASALMFFATALCAFLFLREIGVTEAAALFGAAAWMLSPHTVLLDGRPNAFVFACLPLLMLGLRRLARRIPGGLGATAAVLTLMLLAGHPESMLFAVAGAGVFFLFELARAPAPDRLRAVTLSFLAGGLALALSAATLLPFFEALPQSVEGAHRLAISSGQSKSLPLREAAAGSLGALLPHPHGLEAPPSTEPLPGAFAYATLAYLGWLPLGLAVVGVTRRRWESLALGLAGLTALMVAMGFPIVADVICRLPLFDLSIQSYAIGVTAFCIAALASLGLDALLQGPRRRGRGTLFLSLTASGLLLLALSWRGRFPAGSEVRRAFDRSLLVEIISLAIIVAALRFARGHRHVAAAVVAVLLATRMAEKPELSHVFERRLFYPPIPELAGLPRAETEPYRVAGVGYAMVPNMSALYGLEDPRGYAALTFGRLFATYPLWSVHQPVWFNRIDDPTRPFLSFLNVRFAVDEPSAAVPPGWVERARGRHCTVFENPRTLPRAFAPRRIRFVTAPDRTVAEMASCADFGELSWIEDPDRPAGEIENAAATITTRRRGNDLEVRVRAAAPVWVVVSQTAWRGWEARLPGDRPLPIHFANHAFLGFRVPAGSQEVLLSYRPNGFQAGGAISAAAAALVVGWAVAAARRRRRS